jgi:hypothetical protein
VNVVVPTIKALRAAIVSAVRTKQLRSLMATPLLYLATSPAFAGFSRVADIFNDVNGWLIAAGVSIMTTVILWVGWKVAFRGATMEDISKPLIGGIILGTAPTLAGLLMN